MIWEVLIQKKELIEEIFYYERFILIKYKEYIIY